MSARARDSAELCAKCGHPAYNHEDSDLVLGKCRYWGCRCRDYRSSPRRMPLDEGSPHGRSENQNTSRKIEPAS